MASRSVGGNSAGTSGSTASSAEALSAHGITFCYGELTERIVNRTGDGLCPMESATLEETDPVRALEKIKAKLQELTQKGG